MEAIGWVFETGDRVLIFAVVLTYLLVNFSPYVVRKLQGKNGTATLRGAIDSVIKEIGSLKNEILEMRKSVHEIRDKMGQLTTDAAVNQERINSLDTRFSDFKDRVDRELSELRQSFDHCKESHK